MQITLAILLAVIAIVLILSKRLLSNDALERAANATGIVAAVAALIVLAFYTSSLGSINQPVASSATAVLDITLFPTSSNTPISTQTVNPIDTQLSTASFMVSSLVGWQDTGMHVSRGDRLEISVISGTWTGEIGHAPITNGEGDLGYICGSPSCVEPLPTAPTGALIGQIGDMIFLIGKGNIIISEDEGNLLLRMNDGDSGLHDNEGSLQVEIAKQQ
jgi:hypothetical protein